jgi:hypothetical protein
MRCISVVCVSKIEDAKALMWGAEVFARMALEVWTAME